MKRTILSILFISALLAVTACATVRGVGDDLSTAGRTIKKAAS